MYAKYFIDVCLFQIIVCGLDSVYASLMISIYVVLVMVSINRVAIYHDGKELAFCSFALLYFVISFFFFFLFFLHCIFLRFLFLRTDLVEYLTHKCEAILMMVKLCAHVCS